MPAHSAGPFGLLHSHCSVPPPLIPGNLLCKEMFPFQLCEGRDALVVQQPAPGLAMSMSCTGLEAQMEKFPFCPTQGCRVAGDLLGRGDSGKEEEGWKESSPERIP